MDHGKENAPNPSSSEGKEIAQSAFERSQEIAEHRKHSQEAHNEHQAHQTAEKARAEALQEALFSKEQGKEKRSHQADRHNSTQVITHTDREASFNQTMEYVRHQLPRSTRTFSKLIHNPTVERVSEVVGSTVARPNAILAGSITAFITMLGLYSYARYAGFSLQGSETIIAFAVGWVLGVIFDFLRVMITGKK